MCKIGENYVQKMCNYAEKYVQKMWKRLDPKMNASRFLKKFRLLFVFGFR